jgi:hypothetical protein
VAERGFDPSEIGREISEHGKHHHTPADERRSRRDRILSIIEAVMLSVVAVIAAWSGYSAAKWSTESSVDLAHASATRTKASRADLEATQIRTLDSVSFNAVFAALVAHETQAYRVAVRRLRPGYRPAFNAWVATHPLTNPRAPPGPSYMPQYKIPEADEAKALERESDKRFKEGEHAGSIADKYIRITVFLATVLFLVGISSHFPRRGGRYGLIGIGSALLVLSVVQLLSLPGPPH